MLSTFTSPCGAKRIKCQLSMVWLRLNSPAWKLEEAGALPESQASLCHQQNAYILRQYPSLVHFGAVWWRDVTWIPVMSDKIFQQSEVLLFSAQASHPICWQPNTELSSQCSWAMLSLGFLHCCPADLQIGQWDCSGLCNILGVENHQYALTCEPHKFQKSNWWA